MAGVGATMAAIILVSSATASEGARRYVAITHRNPSRCLHTKPLSKLTQSISVTGASSATFVPHDFKVFHSTPIQPPVHPRLLRCLENWGAASRGLSSVGGVWVGLSLAISKSHTRVLHSGFSGRLHIIVYY